MHTHAQRHILLQSSTAVMAGCGKDTNPILSLLH